LKIVQEGAGVLAKIAKVYGLATASKEKEAVELLEENSTGLMDCTKDCLASRAEFAKKSDDRPGTLCIS
jgi:hypothetical protein